MAEARARSAISTQLSLRGELDNDRQTDAENGPERDRIFRDVYIGAAHTTLWEPAAARACTFFTCAASSSLLFLRLFSFVYSLLLDYSPGFFFDPTAAPARARLSSTLPSISDVFLRTYLGESLFTYGCHVSGLESNWLRYRIELKLNIRLCGIIYFMRIYKTNYRGI